MEMDRKKTEHIRRAEIKNNHATSTGPIQKRRKIRVEVDTSEHAI